jgi:hypothetical protein
MSDVAAGTTRAEVALAVLRRVAGVVLGGVLAGTLFLVIVQEGLRHGWTEQNFNADMGLLFSSVDNETIQYNGVKLTLAVSVGLAIVYALLTEAVWRDRWKRGVWFSVAPFLLWGLVYCPYVAGRIDGEPDAPFGLDDGATIIVGLVASLGFGLVLARVYGLMRTPGWWRPQHRRLGETLQAIETPSLELPEERPEERRVGP